MTRRPSRTKNSWLPSGRMSPAPGSGRRFAVFVVREDQVDVRRNVQFATAQLAHADDQQVLRLAGFARRHAVHLGEFARVDRNRALDGQFGQCGRGRDDLRQAAGAGRIAEDQRRDHAPTQSPQCRCHAFGRLRRDEPQFARHARRPTTRPAPRPSAAPPAACRRRRPHVAARARRSATARARRRVRRASPRQSRPARKSGSFTVSSRSNPPMAMKVAVIECRDPSRVFVQPDAPGPTGSATGSMSAFYGAPPQVPLMPFTSTS